MSNRFDLVIFDLDGTLIDNKVAIRENINYALESHGYLKAGLAQIDSTIGKPLEEAFMRLAPGINLETAKKLRQTYRSKYRSTSHVGVVFLEGVPEVLERLKGTGVKLAVATTKANEELGPLLEKIDLLKYFDIALGRTEGLKMKPDPEMLNHIMKAVGVEPGKTAMVGDTNTDILAGRNAGVYTVGVLSGVKLGFTTREKLEQAKPDVLIDSLKDFRWSSGKKTAV
jgi:HAD superfamily hydrolase (TIGR01509 family)